VSYRCCVSFSLRSVFQTERLQTNSSLSPEPKDSSEQASSAGGTGKTTAEMQMEGTFTEAGWDFVAESVNGTQDIWAICEGVDYPHLAWEFVIGDFDADADTDFADFCILAEHWLAADGSFWCGQGCDLTNDGSVNWQDPCAETFWRHNITRRSRYFSGPEGGDSSKNYGNLQFGKMGPFWGVTSMTE
jgi:hypothetical protein